MAEFAQEAIIGRPAATSYSFCGLQWKSTEFIRQAIAPMARRMQDEGVAAVLLTPARPFCCQSAGLAARCLEAEGFCTVALAPTPEFYREVAFHALPPSNTHMAGRWER